MLPEISENYDLQTTEKASFDVQILWVMKALAKLLKITKKELREAKRILQNPRLEDEIMVREEVKEETFHYGYRSFVLIKKGKRRKILAPHPKVQKVLRAIGNMLAELVSAHEKAFGFVKKRSFQKATKSLRRNYHFISFDIASAFPSITEKMVQEALKESGIREEFIEVLSWFVTYYYDGERRLPTGSSCSPILLNLVYKPMCREIEKLCKKHGIKWFVYADDFNFASREIISDEVKQAIMAIPVKYSFSIKKEKNQDNLGKTIPHILGLTLIGKERQKIHIKRTTKKKFRRIFYMASKCEAYSPAQVEGVAAAISQIYGSKRKNWPGWLLKYWIEYLKKQKEKDNEKRKQGQRDTIP